jgi:hypothetical protein
MMREEGLRSCYAARNATKEPSFAIAPADDEPVHVGFMDTSPRPNVNSMLRVAALCNSSSRVQFHAILKNPVNVPGFRITPLRLSGSASCLHQGLSNHSWGHGPDFLVKPLLHFVVPHDVKRLILLDCDTVPVRDVRELWEEFKLFCGAVIGVVREQSMLYQRSMHLVGYNGGVQLLDLQAMRASALYSEALDKAANSFHWRRHGWHKGGWLGDQTLYSFYAADYPSLIRTLPCEWNRQLGSDFYVRNRHADGYLPGTPGVNPDHYSFGFTNATVHTCPRRCGVLHANLAQLKCIARLMHANPSCKTWAAVQRALVNGSAHSVEDLLIGKCPIMSGEKRVLLGLTLIRYFSSCCVPAYRGPLRPPEGPTGTSVVVREVRRVRAREIKDSVRRARQHSIRRGSVHGHDALSLDPCKS